MYLKYWYLSIYIYIYIQIWLHSYLIIVSYTHFSATYHSQVVRQLHIDQAPTGKPCVFLLLFWPIFFRWGTWEVSDNIGDCWPRVCFITWRICFCRFDLMSFLDHYWNLLLQDLKYRTPVYFVVAKGVIQKDTPSTTGATCYKQFTRGPAFR